MSSLVAGVASLGLPHAPCSTSRSGSHAVLGIMVRSTAPPALDSSRTATSSGFVGAVASTVTLTTAGVATVGGRSGAIRLDVTLPTAAVALLGIGGARSFAGRRLVTGFETVKASTLGEGAVFSQVAHCEREKGKKGKYQG